MKTESKIPGLQPRSIVASRMARIKQSPGNAANQPDNQYQRGEMHDEYRGCA